MSFFFVNVCALGQNLSFLILSKCVPANQKTRERYGEKYSQIKTSFKWCLLSLFITFSAKSHVVQEHFKLILNA